MLAAHASCLQRPTSPNEHVESKFLPLLRSSRVNLRLAAHHPAAGVIVWIQCRNSDRPVTSPVRRAGSGGESVLRRRWRNRDRAGDDEPRVHVVGAERGIVVDAHSADERARRRHSAVHRHAQRSSCVPSDRNQGRRPAPANLAGRQTLRISRVLDDRDRGGRRRRPHGSGHDHQLAMPLDGELGCSVDHDHLRPRGGRHRSGHVPCRPSDRRRPGPVR